MMILYRSHKIHLYPNEAQAAHFVKACGVARFAYNWALAEWQRQYEAHRVDASLPKPTEAALRRHLNAIKREEFPWMLEVTKCAPQEAIRHLGRAYATFFAGKSGRPKFKKSGRCRESLSLTSDKVGIEHRRIRIPKLGWVKMAEEPRWPDAKLISVTISRSAGEWYASLAYEIEIAEPTHEGAPAGVDLGVKDLAITSDGVVYPNTRVTKRGAAKLRRLNKELHRRKKGSKNREKTKLKLQRHHERMHNQRVDAIHKMTRSLVNEHSLIGIEDLNVTGMAKSRSLSKTVSDAAFGETRRQLEYKAEETGTQIYVADRWFPSTKMCSQCGVKNQDLTLSHRSWTCACGASHDRDVNAAINLKNLAVSSTVAACGVGSAGSDTRVIAKLPSAKQESGVPLCMNATLRDGKK